MQLESLLLYNGIRLRSAGHGGAVPARGEHGYFIQCWQFHPKFCKHIVCSAENIHNSTDMFTYGGTAGGTRKTTVLEYLNWISIGGKNYILAWANILILLMEAMWPISIVNNNLLNNLSKVAIISQEGRCLSAQIISSQSCHRVILTRSPLPTMGYCSPAKRRTCLQFTDRTVTKCCLRSGVAAGDVNSSAVYREQKKVMGLRRETNINGKQLSGHNSNARYWLLLSGHRLEH